MNALDRAAVAGILAMTALFPLFGTFGAFDPSRPPIALIGGTHAAIAVGIATALAGMLALAGIIARRPAPPTLWPGLANVAATFLGTAFGFDPATGLIIALTLLGFFAVHIGVLGYYRESGVPAALYLSLLISGGLGSLAALVMALTRHPTALYVLNHGRAVGAFLNPNELAAYLLVYLGAASGLALARPGTALGRFAAGCALLGAIALVATFSRWGLVSAVAGVVVFAVAARARRVVALAALALILGAGANLAFEAHFHDPQDTDARAVAMRAGLATFAHFPLTGVGPLAFERLYPVMRAPDAPGARTPVAFDPHDLPLAILAETGIVGLAAIVWYFAVLTRAVRRALRTAAPAARTLALANGAGLTALCVHSLLNSVSIVFGLFALCGALTLAAAQWGFENDAVS
jgi:O-antigen ligase